MTKVGGDYADVTRQPFCGRICFQVQEQLPMPHVSVELIPDPEYGGFTARLPDLPAYGEGDTEEAAIADLREAVLGYIEAFGLADAMSRITPPLEVRQVDWNLAELDRA
jgi:hypothetical protein